MEEEEITFHQILRRLISGDDPFSVASDTGLINDINYDMPCPKCGSRMVTKREKKIRKCCRTDCRLSISLLYPLPNTRGNISIDVYLLIYACFCQDFSQHDTEAITGASHCSVNHWYGVFRTRAVEKCEEEFIAEGVGFDVQADECLVAKRKYNVGRFVEGRWVIGLCENIPNGKCFIEGIHNRTSATLLPIISQAVHKDGILRTDMWRGYSGVENLGINHMTVNHSKNFVDPSTGTTTNRMEGIWGAYKRWRNKKGYIFKEYTDSYVKEWVYRYNHKHNFADIWRNLFR